MSENGIVLPSGRIFDPPPGRPPARIVQPRRNPVVTETSEIWINRWAKFDKAVTESDERTATVFLTRNDSVRVRFMSTPFYQRKIKANEERHVLVCVQTRADLDTFVVVKISTGGHEVDVYAE